MLASASAEAATFVRAVPATRRPLALVPSDARGWFGGAHIVCWDPLETARGLSRSAAAGLLERAMASPDPLLAAAVLPYDGPAEVRTYTGGLVRTAEGWRAWGTVTALPSALDIGPAPRVAGPLILDPAADLDEAGYRARVERVRERIAAGDVYVLNLTYRIAGRPALAAAAAFGVLTERAAGPMSAWWGEASSGSLASVSPERFCAIETDAHGHRHVWIEPIKGTRPRGADPGTDAALARELAGDAKERAEHVMIVDLERNDLGRVAVPGSVHVDPMLEVFATPYCHQLVSRVRALMVADATLGDLVEATFPCGSVTGAPKRAAMRIIGELERSPRGAYTGALAVALPGRFDSSVLIRTLEYGPDAVHWGTGGGITIDSDPEAEWRESRLKAVPVLGAAAGDA